MMATPTSPAKAEPEDLEDAAEEPEVRKVTRLLRVMSLFVMWPAFTGGLVFLVVTGPIDHWMHIGGLLTAGLAAVVVFATAPRLAARIAGTP